MAKFKVDFRIEDANADVSWTIDAKDMEDAKKQAEEMTTDADVMVDTIKAIDYVNLKVHSIKKLKEVV